MLKDEATVVNPPAAIWKPGYFKLFLSHISSEKVFVSAVKTELAAFGVDGFVAHVDIQPTQNWQDTIERALAECDALIAFLHSGFHDSLWTDQEVGFVRGRGVLVVPVRLGSDPYGFIGRYQALRGLDDAAKLARAIVDCLTDHELTARSMDSALVQAIEDSPSFAAARARVAFAEDYVRWTPELLRQLEGATASNRQVRESTGVPALIRQIVENHGASASTAANLNEEQPSRPPAQWRITPNTISAGRQFHIVASAQDVNGDPIEALEVTASSTNGHVYGSRQRTGTDGSVTFLAESPDNPGWMQFEVTSDRGVAGHLAIQVTERDILPFLQAWHRGTSG